VTGFSADWLALREPYDARARNSEVLDALAAAVADRGSLAVIDLACGAGATLRAISSRLPPSQRWRLVDHDLELLERAASAPAAGAAQVAAIPADIACEIEAVLDEPADLVTASALLDLVSTDWLDRLARTIVRRRLLLYAALTYDGRVTFEPADPFDSEMIRAFDRHQRGDKGFGPALGPTAGEAAIARFETLGYTVAKGASDWVLGRRDVEIQSDLLTGWAAAANELADPDPAEIKGWLERRRHHLASGRSSIGVGHIDFFASPIRTRRAERSQSNSTSPSRAWMRVGGRSA
jgi:hypothetical protein